MGRVLQLSLPDELEAEVAAAVARGEYASEADAVLGAVIEWRTQRLVETMGIEELRRLWRDGIDSGPGRFETIDEIKAEARRRFEQS
jgi:antitoxin ParD1/3/4